MRHLSTSLLFLLVSTFAMAQVDTEFWFAAPWMNSHHTGEAEFHIIISAYDKDAHVQITQPAWGNRKLADTTILAGSYCDLLIGPKTDHKQYAEANLEAPYNQIAPRGLYITTDNRISAYYQITHANGEAYTLKGRNALGTDFVVMSQMTYPNYPNYNGYNSHNNSVQIVATQNNTQVTITPTQPVVHDDGTTSTTPITVTLQRGETYAVKSATTTAAAHLIGTRITASAPIAVTTSDDSVNQGSGQDAVGEQLVPTDMAGTDYTVIPLSNSTTEYCYILALNAATNVTLTNATGSSQIALANVGDWQQHKLNGTTYIQADKDIQVFQFTCRNGESGGTVLPQMLCTGSKHVTYKRIPNSDLCYLNILTQTVNTAYLTMNGNHLPQASFKPVPGNPSWSYITYDATAKPASMPVEVEIGHGVFQLGVVDHAAIPQGTLTYGFFSDYATTSPVHVTFGAQDIDTALVVDEGDRVMLIASAADGVGQFTWWRNGQQIATGDTLIIESASPTNDGTYEARAISDVCTVEYAEFTFTVTPTPVPEPVCPEFTLDYPRTICGDQGSLNIDLTIEKGRFAKAEILFSDSAHTAGIQDQTFTTVGAQLSVAIPTNVYVQPSFGATLVLYPESPECDTIYTPIRFAMQYPSSVFMQRWNDVLSVLNERYNRGQGVEGYHFTAFQWYRNDQPIPGATDSYYYCGPDATLDMTAEYRILLTRDDGTSILTCPYIPQLKNVSDQ